jgi:RNA polymerase sigma-70 factor (ECF subfamily)
MAIPDEGFGGFYAKPIGPRAAAGRVCAKQICCMARQPLKCPHLPDTNMNALMSALDPHAWLADHGDYLFRVARRQLHSDELAEDAVQETLLAALAAQTRYAGDASPRTWLTGILKHKIIDAIRRQLRETEIPRDVDGEEAVDRLFQQDGHWVEPLLPWGNPQREAELSQLRRVLDDCAGRLKPVMAQVLSLREVAGMETGDICKELAITPTNCWVLLHRARLFMRQCLELNGFAKAGAA